MQGGPLNGHFFTMVLATLLAALLASWSPRADAHAEAAACQDDVVATTEPAALQAAVPHFAAALAPRGLTISSAKSWWYGPLPPGASSPSRKRHPS